MSQNVIYIDTYDINVTNDSYAINQVPFMLILV